MNRQGVTPLKGFPPPKRRLHYGVFITSTIGLRAASDGTRSLCRAARDVTNFRRLESMFSRAVWLLIHRYKHKTSPPRKVSPESGENLPPCVTLPFDLRGRRDLLKVGYWRRNAADMPEALTSVC